MKHFARQLKHFTSIGDEEAKEAIRVIDSGPLSGYIGSNDMGGMYCRLLERDWMTTFGVKHAVAVNSATSGLLAACMAVGVEHGDEVIVSPYTMSATAAAPKILGATLKWADIEPDTFSMDPVDVANLITHRTKAVIVTNLFGHPAHLQELRDICDAQGVYLIEDNAQSIFAQEHDKYAGTIGHIGVFSLNVHKHLQVGEGGICVTNNDTLASKLREAMNHGELRNGIIGLNLRMTEVTAAMARAQLDKAPAIMNSRIHIGKKLTEQVIAQDLCVGPPVIRQDCTHSFYVWSGILFEEPSMPLPYPFKRGYLKPLYHLPAFKSQQESLPVVEGIEKNIVLVEVCSIDPTDDEICEMVEDLGRCL